MKILIVSVLLQIVVVYLLSFIRNKYRWLDYAFVLVACLGVAAHLIYFSANTAIVSGLIVLGLGFIVSGIWRKNVVVHNGSKYNVNPCYNCGYNHSEIIKEVKDGTVTFKCKRCGYVRSAMFR